jgi:23S rRNA (pseudouridine1915-N3)-methyltransferase
VKIRLLSVGRPRDPELVSLHDRYAERIRRFGVAYATKWVPEVRAGGSFSDEHVREREGRSLIDQLGRGRPIALDRSGTMLDSEGLAKRLEGWATPEATLIVGGPLGLHGDVLARSRERWSLSRLTFPHELVRVLVAEQLYRALTLQRRIPYHK